MPIFFSILKGIAILFLIIIVLLLLALLYAIFSPIRYTFGGEWRDVKSLNASVCDFLRFVKVNAKYMDENLSVQVSLLWGLIKKELNDNTDEEQQNEEKSLESLENSVSVSDGEPEGESVSGEGVTESDNAKMKKSISGDTSSGDGDSASHSNNVVDNDKDIVKRSLLESDKNAPQTNIDSVSEEKIDVLDEKDDFDESFSSDEAGEDSEVSAINKIGGILSHPGNKRAFELLWNGGWQIFGKVRPHFENVDADFSLGDPYWTGRTLGLVAMNPFMYGAPIELRPDFESDLPYVKGIAKCFGRVQLYYIIFFAIKVLLSKDCRRLYRQIRA